MSHAISRLKAIFFQPTLRSREPKPRKLRELAFLCGFLVLGSILQFFENHMSLAYATLAAAGALVFAAELLPRGGIVLAGILRIVAALMMAYFLIDVILINMIFF